MKPKPVHPVNPSKFSRWEPDREPNWDTIGRLLERPIAKCCASAPPCELCPSALHSSSKESPPRFR